MARLQVSCINKGYRTSPHERISSIGGVHNGSLWKHSVSQAILNIESNINAYYVHVRGYETNVIIATHNGNKYLKTESDNTTTDNLLSLKECL